MNLPQNVTPEVLASLAAPDEKLAVRVLIRRTANTGLQTLRGRFRRYIAKRDDKLGCHVIDIPLSVWMNGVPRGTYHDNQSVCHDIMGNRPVTKAPLVLLIVPWSKAKPEEETAGPEAKDMTTLRQLAEVLGAPELLLAAIDLVASDRSAEDVEKALRVTIANVLQEPGSNSQPGVASEPTQTPSAKPEAPEQKPVAKKATKRARKKALSNAERQKLHRAKKKAERQAKETAGATA